MQGVIASGFQRPLRAALMAARACESVQLLGAARAQVPPADRTLARGALRNAADHARRVSREIGTKETREAIRDALVPWALGDGDPVGSRVTKRGIVELKPEDLEA